MNWFTCHAIGHWARLTIPLSGLSKQVDRLLESYCWLLVTLMHTKKVIQTATHLRLILAECLADTMAWLVRSILDHKSKILFDTDTEPLLTPGFWILFCTGNCSIVPSAEDGSETLG